MKFVLLLVLALTLETIRLSWFGQLPILLDPVLALVVIVGLTRKQPAGAVFGFTVGLLRDWLYGGPAGFSTLVFTGLGASMGSLGKTIYRDSAVTHGVMITGALLIRGFVEYLLVSRGSPAGLPMYLLKIVFPGALISALVVPGAYHGLLYWRRRKQAVDIEAILEEATRRELNADHPPESV